MNPYIKALFVAAGCFAIGLVCLLMDPPWGTGWAEQAIAGQTPYVGFVGCGLCWLSFIAAQVIVLLWFIMRVASVASRPK